jgi:hypothetical protein
MGDTSLSARVEGKRKMSNIERSYATHTGNELSVVPADVKLVKLGVSARDLA